MSASRGADRRIPSSAGNSSQRGQSMVEFALIGPLFFLVTLAVIECSLLFNAQITIDNAVREGARAAGICGSSKAAAVNFHGTTYTGQPSACPAAIIGEVQRSTGFLKVLSPNINPAVSMCSPPPDVGRCATAYSGAPRGSVIQVEAKYNYSFYIFPFLGESSPTITLSSTAKVVSQQ
jgi:hypothetical protein